MSLQRQARSPLLPVNPVAFAAIEGLQILEPLGRGDRIANDIFITNDANTKNDILAPFLDEIGTVSYYSILNDHTLLGYWRGKSIPNGKELDTLRGFLRELSHFEKLAWLQQDHAIRHGDGWLFANGYIWPYYLDGRLSRADGTTTDINLNREQLRKLRERHRDDWKPVAQEDLKSVPQPGRSTRTSRALYYVFLAQCSQVLIEKVTNYCSALEALVATSRGELSHQLAERSAILFSDQFDGRRATYQHVKRCYDLRSKFTHGAQLAKKELDSISAMSVQLDDIVRVCLNRALSDDDMGAAMDDDNALSEWFLIRLLS